MSYPATVPALYLLPVGLSDTPSSNVIPQSNIEIMRGLRFFIVENIRTARRWIRSCDPSFSFDGIEFAELNAHTPEEEVFRMLDPLRKGNSVGVMSEAGCPAVADPGADIVALAQRENLKVVPLVGPSSILMGLMGSGFNGQSFCFNGYLPIDEGEKRRELQRLEKDSERENRTQIFIETPYRNDKLLRLMTECLRPDTKICVACDITAPDERIITKTAGDWRKDKIELTKRPTIFLIYRGFAAQSVRRRNKER